MLETRNVSVFYGRHRALENVSATVSKGEIVVMLGANGAGKSTFLARHRRTDAQDGRAAAVLMDGADITRRAAARDRRNRHRARARGSRHFRRSHRAGKSRARRPSAARARAGEADNLERVLGLFPKLKQRRKAARAHHERRRAADGGDRPRHDVGADHPAARRAVARPVAAVVQRSCSARSPASRTAGVGIFLVEQNAKQSLAIADRGYLLDNGHIVGADSAAALAKDAKVKAAYLGE